MTSQDLIELAFFNLWRTKLRTVLTTLGVVIGIGALTSMISFGTGMQKNIIETFKQNDLFTSIFVSGKNINLNQMAQGDLSALAVAEEDTLALNDGALETIQQIDGVEIAYPEVRFPVQLVFNGKETKTEAQAIPVLMKDYAPFNEVAFGHFYENNNDPGVVLKWETFSHLNYLLAKPGTSEAISLADSLKGLRTIHPDDILGKPVQIITTVIDVQSLMRAPWQVLQSPMRIPFRQDTTTLPVIGILKQGTDFAQSRFKGDCIIPFATAQAIPRMAFSSVWDLLGNTQKKDDYGSLYVRASDPGKLPRIRTSIEALGFHTFSITDELEEIKRAFLVMDSILGAVGTIALFVAALGIINTMVMSILERTREIGIMKAIGASNHEIKTIFFVEAGAIGFIGALLGLGLGWMVTRVANWVANVHLKPTGQPEVDFFYFPLWLIFGSIVFSILISLMAGLYPASRAAKVDPVKALRHD